MRTRPRPSGMAAPGPRRLLSDPSRFGYVAAAWPDVADHPQVRAEVAAAFFVHQTVLALRRTLTERGITLSELAVRLDVKPETLRRKVRGEAWATLADVLSWALELGVDLLPAPVSREELVP